MSSCGEDEASHSTQPIAIVGMSMRLPGGIKTSEQFWDMLIQKKDGHGQVPPSRYDVDKYYSATPKKGTVYTRTGYFLEDDLAAFDAAFFSLTKSEVAQMDPQQRMLCEVVWECFENAGQKGWRSQNIGCYVGVFGEDWLEISRKDTQDVGSYHVIGTGDYAISNRISYEYDLKGPSMTIRTACSSSLTGLHEACRALRQGECVGAIVAGTNLIMAPTTTIGMCEVGVLSRDGRCKTFDATADGYGRGEAINAIYIKKLDDAIRDGNPIRAVIRGTAVNSDGRTPNITYPSATAQEQLIRKAYKSANIEDISQTGFFECHGTGTVAGDTVETIAISKAFDGEGIILGSVKANVGHSEGASGLTSLIKVVLVLEKGIIPPNPYFTIPNPKIPFDEAHLHVPTEPTLWPQGKRLRASVNSFGIGGSNAHAIIEAATSAIHEPSLCEGQYRIIPYSANSKVSLQRSIDAHAQYMAHNPDQIRDVGHTLGVCRETLKYRAYTLSGPNGVQKISHTSRLMGFKRNLVFVFTGQGAQWPGMGRELMALKAFRETIVTMSRTLEQLDDCGSWSLLELTAAEMESPELSQPLCTALQVGLVEVLRSWNIHPSAVVGHSSGEIAAAYTTGAITAEQAIKIAYFRGQVSKLLRTEGGMAAVGLSRDIVADYLEDGVIIACENSPESVTISGDKSTVVKVLSRISEAFPSAFCRHLRVKVAYHSHHMKGVGEIYEQLLNFVEERNPAIPFYSSVTGDILGSELGAKYWRQNLELPVLFSSAARCLLDQLPKSEDTVMLEIGPHAVLSAPLKQIFNHKGNTSIVYLPTLSRGSDSLVKAYEAAGELYLQGIPIDFLSINGPGKVLTNLPLYCWQHDSDQHWYESRLSKAWRHLAFPKHEILGSRISETGELGFAWRNVLSLGDMKWLRDHKVFDDTIFPSTAYIAAVGEAIRQLTGRRDYTIRRLLVRTPIILKQERATEIITSFNVIPLTEFHDSAWYSFSISAFNGNSWIKHCTGQVKPGSDQSLVANTKSHMREVSSQGWYQGLNNLGLDYGPTFQRLAGIRADPLANTASANVPYSEELHQTHYSLHPTTADCALQLLSVAACRGLRRKLNRLVVPVSIDHVYVDEIASTVHLLASSEELENKKLKGSVVGTIDDHVVFAFNGCVLAPLNGETSDMDEIETLNISHLEWASRLEDLPAPDLIYNTTPAASMIVSCEELAVLCMLETVHELQSQSLRPEAPYLQQYIAWIQKQVYSMINGSYDLVPKAQEWSMLGSQHRRVLIQELIDDPARSRCTGIDALIVRVYHNIRELCNDSVSGIDLLYQEDGLKNFYDVMASLDLSGLFSTLGHENPSLRVLEIGAGTGGTTALALNGLNQSNGPRLYSRYCYTDISMGFFPAARERFRKFHGIDFAVLDISQDPVDQGFKAQDFDLVIASNVLHATPELGTALRHVRKLLAPGGRLLLQELCPKVRFINFVMGVLPGWWIGSQDSREEEAFVSPERWNTELQKSGFAGIDKLAYDNEPPYATNATMVATVRDDDTQPSAVTLLCSSIDNKHVRAVERHFTTHGYTVHLCSLRSLPPTGDVVSLLDIEGPFFDNISDSDLIAFQKFVSGCKSTGILWITRSIQLKCADPRFGLVLGLARTIRSELAVEMGTVEFEYFDQASWTALESIYRKFQARDKTDSTNTDFEFVHQDGKILTSRYKRHTPEEILTLQSSSISSDAVGLRIEAFGRLNSLAWVPLDKPDDLQGDQVEINVHSAGLNFKDLLCAQGILDARKDGLGLEGSGVVNRVGPHSSLTPGQRVMFMSPGSFATSIVTSSLLCAPIPDNIEFDDAATMPCVYATAIHSLMTIGQLKKGQTVLIHSACGGVGLAAIMISRMIGAEVYATVGSGTKTKYLQDRFCIPRDHIFNSREPSFYEDMMRQTDGRGVDLVLNSLSGELLHASWKCVARFGKMVEIGKRDIVGHANLSLAPMVQNRSLISVDLAEILEYQPQECQRLLEMCVDLVRRGTIQPIRPVRAFDATEIEQAFRYMQAGQHTGKIVVNMSTRPCPTRKMPATISFSSTHAYLLVGGLGGIGRAVSQWMVEQGARKLVYLSRSASSPTTTREALLRELRVQGCEVTVIQGDVSDLCDVQRAVQQCNAPIAGVFQMSMALEDRAFLSMSHVEWTNVLLPKVQGNWNLHQATQGEPLDFFVSFSSISGILGQPGQANYAAANTFLDCFTKYRRSLGLPASVIDLGIVRDIGYVSESGRMTQRGLAVWAGQTIQEREVIESVKLACGGQHDVIIGLAPGFATPLARLPGFFQRDKRMRLFHNAQEAPQARGDVDNGLRTFLAEASREPSILGHAESYTLLRDELGRKIVSFLFKADEELDTTRSLVDMGIDSLVVIEIRNWWCQTLELEISVMEFMNAGNIDGLAHIALKGLKAKFQPKHSDLIR
ncbi:polyketide synthase [Aspergillus pseudotamarii]|uniref:Polyketide synthase n=1 Tax=Aspergillus pseudotamarii TaxID=132259 RepID=A0A5N6T650_ASPPS|nr:polyketide synthase [Aspergillus pseudotamarii]KAE8141770.1 polyketide synthase [Aspergillus pseudotamarii]